ncbi:MAG: hypothetical protein Q8P56_06535 [Candidatus Uhrbacteria bacterium]|nr:hypothetical protein [Candidatus Uhrbacteria bacterium]
MNLKCSISIFFTIIIIGVGLGYIYYQKQSPFTIEDIDAPPSPPQFLISPELNITKLGDDEIYRNETFGYEIKYPKDFSILIVNEFVQIISNQIKKSNNIEISVLREEFDGMSPKNLQDINAFYKYVDKLISKLATIVSEKESDLYIKEAIKFNGYDAVEIRYRDPAIVGRRILVYHNNQAFQVLYSAFSGYEKPVTQILSSFKFFK